MKFFHSFSCSAFRVFLSFILLFSSIAPVLVVFADEKIPVIEKNVEKEILVEESQEDREEKGGERGILYEEKELSNSEICISF